MASGPTRYCSTRTPLNAVAFIFGTEIVMSEARNDVVERGLLIGGKSVPASSGKLADDVSPWDGEIYARVAPGAPADITRAADAAQAAFPSWSAMGAFERREIFLKAADVTAKRAEEAIVARGPNGTLIRPVVLTDVRPDTDIFASEIFGPAVVIHPVDSTEAVIDLVNDRIRADRRGHLPRPQRRPRCRLTRPVRDHPHQRPGHRR